MSAMFAAKIVLFKNQDGDSGQLVTLLCSHHLTKGLQTVWGRLITANKKPGSSGAGFSKHWSFSAAV